MDSQAPQTRVRLVENFRTSVETLAPALNSARVITWDWETDGNGLNTAQPVGLGIYIPDTRSAWYLNVAHLVQNETVPRCDPVALRSALIPYFSDPSRQAIGHNAQYDMAINARFGVTSQRCRFADSLIMTHRANENLGKIGDSDERAQFLGQTTNGIGYGLKNQIWIQFEERPMSFNEATNNGVSSLTDPARMGGYCVNDCVNTWRLYESARRIIDADPQLAALQIIDDENVSVVFRMMDRGIPVNIEETERQDKILRALTSEITEEIWKRIGKRFDISTKTRVLDMLQSLGCVPEGKSLKREVLIDCINLESNQVTKEILALLIYRGFLNQRLSSFITPALERHIDRSRSRIFLTKFQPMTATTRFTCTPNFQALPKRADKTIGRDRIWRDLLPPLKAESPKTRKIITAPPGYVLISTDLSAAEPRYVAQKMQNSLQDRGVTINQARKNAWRISERRNPDLFEWRNRRQIKQTPPRPETQYPEIRNDPLWQAFVDGKDPYEAISEAAGLDGRDVAKKFWLSFAYMTSAEGVAPSLEMSVEKTQEFIDKLEVAYPMLPILRDEVRSELLSKGMIRTLFGRPRRLPGAYQLATEDKCRIVVYQNKTYYEMDIVPLGFLQWGINCFVSRCWRMDDGKHVLVADRQTQTYEADLRDAFIGAEHMYGPPFRNPSYSVIQSVTTRDKLVYPVPRIERSIRKAFNAQFQGTGADHLRWIMNRIDSELLIQPRYKDISFILSIHDELLFECPDDLELIRQFQYDLLRTMRTPPSWATLPIGAEITIGKNYSEMKSWFQYSSQEWEQEFSIY